MSEPKTTTVLLFGGTVVNDERCLDMLRRLLSEENAQFLVVCSPPTEEMSPAVSRRLGDVDGAGKPETETAHGEVAKFAQRATTAILDPLRREGHIAGYHGLEQHPVLTDATEDGFAEIVGIKADLVKQELGSKVVFIPGSQGWGQNDSVRCTGPHSSDLIAAMIAAGFKCDMVKITDVPGIFDRDPKENADARHYRYLSYETAININARVIHPDAVRAVREAGRSILVTNLEMAGQTQTVVSGSDDQFHD